MKIRPGTDKIVVKRLSSNEDKSSGGIIIQAQDQIQALFGEVLAVEEEYSEYEPGDKVFFNTGITVAPDVYILKEEDILGVVCDDDDETI